MSVYIFAADQFRLVKIGYASNVLRRLAQTQTACPCELHIAAVIPGDRACEKALHKRFASRRVRGEWFDCCDEITALTKAFPASSPMTRAFKKWPKSRLVYNHSELIEALGGNKAVADALACRHQSAPSQWKMRGRIPADVWPQVIELAALAGITGISSDWLARTIRHRKTTVAAESPQ